MVIHVIPIKATSTAPLSEQCSKLMMVGDYIGLYLPIHEGLTYSMLGIPINAAHKAEGRDNKWYGFEHCTAQLCSDVCIPDSSMNIDRDFQ